MNNDLSYEVWSRYWQDKEGAAWELQAVFRYDNAARRWAEFWFGTKENECKDSKLTWQIRIRP